MKIAIFGSGYVGLVSGACFSDMGNQVIGVDINEERVALLNQGISPIYEFGLEELLQKNLALGNLLFTTNAREAIQQAQIIFIAVGTPSSEDGSVNLNFVDQVATTIGEYLDSYKVVVNKSTVPVGTADRVKNLIQQQLDKRKCELNFDVVSNPEFLKEGVAISDFMKPDRIVIGADSEKAFALMHELYAQFNRNHNRTIDMDTRSAEMTKYAANAMLATKISFINEMANIAEKVGADIEKVRLGIGSDQRIGYHFIYPGCGYGGSCFPKDVRGLMYAAAANNYDAKILQAVHQVNEEQKNILFKKITHYFNDDLENKIFAVWGLAFKPNTDDIREAPSCVLIKSLLKAGAKVRAYDPQAMSNVKDFFSGESGLSFSATKEEVLKSADALVIVTEWSEFKNPDFNLIKRELIAPVMFDGRNLFNPEYMKKHGFTYQCIGRSA